MPFVPVGTDGLFAWVDPPEYENPTDVSPETLAEYVGGVEADAFVIACFEQARAMVNHLVGLSNVPVEVLGRAYLEAGSELVHRKNAPQGISQFASPDGSAIRVARDPLVGVYPIIQPFLGPGIA